MKKPLIGVLETGGTKFLVGVGREGDGLLEQTRVPCTNPGETMARVFQLFQDAETRHGHLEALGVGSFGPLDLNIDSATHGHITHTPKSAWRNFDLLGALRSRYPLPTVLDTDVNAAARAEALWGAGKGLDHVLYLTVGTGIGGGFFIRGQALHGLTHPEMGHILIGRDEAKDPFSGVCPIHRNCLEGLASGPAMEARWRTKAENLPPSHPAWDLEAEYLGRALVNFLLVLSPEIIIVGGGVGEAPGLLAKVRQRFREELGGYIRHPRLDALERFIVAPSLGPQAGILGALALGQEAWHRGRSRMAPEI